MTLRLPSSPIAGSMLTDRSLTRLICGLVAFISYFTALAAGSQ